MQDAEAERIHADLSRRILASAIRVHRRLGPGLLESAYRGCLARQFELDGLAYELETPISLVYEGTEIENAYRADLIVEGSVLLELKAVERLLSLHYAQILTYLRLTGLKVGLLLNFNVPRLKDGMRRFVL